MTVFFDTGEPERWAEAMRLPPWIEDSDGFTFYNGAFLSPDVRFECPFDAVQDGHNARPADVARSFHDAGDSHDGQ